jgi:hypothetical protein
MELAPSGGQGTAPAAALRAERCPDSGLASSSTMAGVADQAGQRGVLAGGASPELAVLGRGARRCCLSGAQRLSGRGGGSGGSAGVPARRRSGCPFLAADWERLGGAGASQHYFLTRGGEVGWGVERTGEGAAGGAIAPEPWGGGSWNPGGPLPASPTSRGDTGSVAPAKAEPSPRCVRAGGGGEDRLLRCGPSPLASPFPPNRAGLASTLRSRGLSRWLPKPRLLAAACGPTTARHRRTRRRAESGAAPPPFCPNAGRLLPRTTASRDEGLGLKSSRLREASRRAAAPRGRSGRARGSPAPGAPCTPRALCRSGRSRRSSLLARRRRRRRRSALRIPSSRRLPAPRAARASAQSGALPPPPSAGPRPQPRRSAGILRPGPGTAGTVPLPHLKFSPRPSPPGASS